MPQTNVHPLVTHLYRRLHNFKWPTPRARTVGLHNMSLVSYGSRDALGDGEAWLQCVIELTHTKYIPRVVPSKQATAVICMSLAATMMTERSFKYAAAECIRVLSFMPRTMQRQYWTEFANDVTDLLTAFGSPGSAWLEQEGTPAAPAGLDTPNTTGKKQFRYDDGTGWIDIVTTTKAAALDMLGTHPRPNPAYLQVKKGTKYVKA